MSDDDVALLSGSRQVSKNGGEKNRHCLLGGRRAAVHTKFGLELRLQHRESADRKRGDRAGSQTRDEVRRMAAVEEPDEHGCRGYGSRPAKS